MADETIPKLKKKKKKQPNPLSCKKKKKKKMTSNAGAEPSMNNSKSNIDRIQQKTIEKKTKRKRIKLPTHIKEMLHTK